MPLVSQLCLVTLSVVYAFAILAQANYGATLAAFPPDLQANASAWYISKDIYQFDTFGRYASSSSCSIYYSIWIVLNIS